MRKVPRPTFQVFFAAGCVLLAIAMASAQSPQEIAQKAFRSVVLVVIQDRNGQALSLGSGFFVRQFALVTNLHVIEGGSKGYAKLVGQPNHYPIAGIVGIDDRRDLVLLSVPDVQAPSLPLGSGQQVAVGDPVFVVGNPMGFEGTFSQGIVSGLRRVALVEFAGSRCAGTVSRRSRLEEPFAGHLAVKN